MARIRSIKPDFFLSENLAKVSRATRLTFIGLWTYVDDNGVGIDNELLITAALYPLDTDPSDPAAILRSVSEDLRSLASLGVVIRYLSTGKRYLFITNWDEHQVVSHPRKPRYPRPDLTCKNGPLLNGSGGIPEPLRRISGVAPP